MKNSVRELLQSDPTSVFEVRHGIERECLRVTKEGHISNMPHPAGLGAKLTHKSITTDYSENLLEFITDVHASSKEMFRELESLHAFTNKKMGQELLWPYSMPAILPADEREIPVANFGQSHVGKMKSLYREGLGHRYGKSMQSIAGLHYNFSMSDTFWKTLLERESFKGSLTEFKNQKYFHLIRNFRRYRWLLMYFFGVSNIVHESFLVGKKHNLEKLTQDSYYDPNALSLRMGGLGYTSSAQGEISICFNKVDSYINTLEEARLKSVPAYEKIGVFKNGKRLQLNSNLLQIDNEFYSTIRPKNIAKSKESALKALHLRGIEYIEVRLTDINPFSPLGVSREQVGFLQLFLLWCLQTESPIITDKECAELEANFSKVVSFGRQPSIKLSRNDEKIDLKDWALEIMDEIGTLANQLSTASPYYITAYDSFARVLDSSDLQLAQKLLNSVRTQSFVKFNLDLANEYKTDIKIDQVDQDNLEKYTLDSITAEKELVKNSKGDFEEFLVSYFKDIKI